MNAEIMTKNRWFWPWQDEMEEAWLGEMSRKGWHLQSVKLLCSYTFQKGEPVAYAYRLDYFRGEPATLPEYLQIFRDAGWEYLGELSNWRYWRKQMVNGETPEIFTDRQSKIQKYQRLLGILAFFLIFLVFMGMNLLRNGMHLRDSTPGWINVVYTVSMAAYALIIPIYAIAVWKILARIKQLKKSLQ